MAVRLAHVKRKQNLVLGHVLSYLVCSKYDIRSPRACDAPPVFFSDASFHILFSTKRSGAAPAAVGGDPEVATEFEHPEASRPMFHGESSSSRASTFDFDGLRSYLDERFDHFEERFDQVDGHLLRLDGRMDRVEGHLTWLRTHSGGQQFPPSDPTAD